MAKSDKPPEKSIAVVAPANPFTHGAAERVTALAAALFGNRVALFFHPQCFLSEGHFAGADGARSDAFVEVANDPKYDAVWFARGGYGSCRIVDSAFGKLERAAHLKTYLGYSDMGFLLARLWREGVGNCVHGPMPNDITRVSGEAAIERSLRYLVDLDPQSLEPAARRTRVFAFNLATLSHIIGTPFEPDFTGAEILLEDIDEPHYRIDRMMFTLASSINVRRAAGMRMGRFSKIPANDPPFGKSVEEIFHDWSRRSGLRLLGKADIGHDADNKVAPFPGDRLTV